MPAKLHSSLLARSGFVLSAVLVLQNAPSIALAQFDLPTAGNLPTVGNLPTAGNLPSATESPAQPSLPTRVNPSPVLPADGPGDDGNLEIPLQAIKPHRSPPVVTALAASRDGRYIAAAGDDHVIRLIDAESGRILGNFSGHTDWIQTVVFSADSKQLYSSGNDGRVLRWDYGQPALPTELFQLPYAVRCLSVSTQKQLLAVGGFGNTIGLWNLQTNAWHLKFSCSCGDQRCVRFSPEGDKLLCGGRDGELSVWDTATGEELAHVPLHRDRIHTAAFSADGQVITSVGDDRRIVRYELLSRKTTLDRELKGAKLRSLCLINDYLIAAAGADNTIHIYDVLADEELGKLAGHSGSVAVMCSCSDRLVSGSFDTTVRLWKLESALLQARGVTRPVGLAPLQVDQNMEIR